MVTQGLPERPGFSIAAQEPVNGKNGATAAFPYDRMTVERSDPPSRVPVEALRVACAHFEQHSALAGHSMNSLDLGQLYPLPLPLT
jgi:hypothetical protein